MQRPGKRVKRPRRPFSRLPPQPPNPAHLAAEEGRGERGVRRQVGGVGGDAALQGLHLRLGHRVRLARNLHLPPARVRLAHNLRLPPAQSRRSRRRAGGEEGRERGPGPKPARCMHARAALSRRSSAPLTHTHRTHAHRRGAAAQGPARADWTLPAPVAEGSGRLKQAAPTQEAAPHWGGQRPRWTSACSSDGVGAGGPAL